MPSLSLKAINKMNNNPLNVIRSLGKDYDIHTGHCNTSYRSNKHYYNRSLIAC